jgi:hypothetical protein
VSIVVGSGSATVTTSTAHSPVASSRVTITDLRRGRPIRGYGAVGDDLPDSSRRRCRRARR